MYRHLWDNVVRPLRLNANFCFLSPHHLSSGSIVSKDEQVEYMMSEFSRRAQHHDMLYLAPINVG